MLGFLYACSALMLTQRGSRPDISIFVFLLTLSVLGNGGRLVTMLRGALFRKDCVFDREAQGFYINGTFTARLSDVRCADVQGRWEGTGLFRCRVVLMLTRDRTVVVVESPMSAPLPYYLSSGYVSSGAERRRFGGEWRRIGRDNPPDDTASAEAFTLQHTISEFLGRECGCES